MAITFDPKKDAINRKKHGISLAQAEKLDRGTAVVVVDDREDYGEVRYRALGFMEARLYSLVFTLHGEDIRAISLRKATRHEAKEYEENC